MYVGLMLEFGFEVMFFSSLDEAADLCGSCPISVGETIHLRRTLDSCIEYKKSLSLATYQCTHEVTGRSICAVPCDGVLELCKDNADEPKDFGARMLWR